MVPEGGSFGRENTGAHEAAHHTVSTTARVTESLSRQLGAEHRAGVLARSWPGRCLPRPPMEHPSAKVRLLEITFEKCCSRGASALGFVHSVICLGDEGICVDGVS